MPTLSELIESLREQAGDYPHRDQLNGAMNSSTTAITVDTGTHIKETGLIEIDFEVMRVVSKSSATVGVVDRGVEGSTAATHADDAPVYAGFRHSKFAYARAINRTLDAISSAFGKRTWKEGDFGTTTYIDDVPADTIHVFAVKAQPTGYTSLEDVPFHFERSLPTSVASTGKGVRLTSWLPGDTVHIGYETPWPNLTALSTALDTTFPTDAYDLIELGAKWYLADAGSFERIAFGEATGRIHGSLASSPEVRLEARDNANDFITRRSDLAAREREERISWLRG